VTSKRCQPARLRSGSGELVEMIFADLAGDLHLHVRWSATAPEGWVDATYVNLTLKPSDASPTTVRAGRSLTSRDNEHVRASGEIMNANVGSPDSVCDRVIVHFTSREPPPLKISSRTDTTGRAGGPARARAGG
jgi:hypothetical protein